MRNLRYVLFFVLLSFLSWNSIAQQRFPKPEFETGYVQPSPTTPEPRQISMEYIDILVLVVVLILGWYFIFKKRSRRGLLWLTVFALLYFGFYREGCICPIGAIQNVTLTLFDPDYAISIPVLAFFVIPLLFALFYGRVFCGAACPLGAIQDLVVIKPVKIPAWLRTTLGLIPFIYLSLAILYAATGTEFIICRYDPFIGIFRMGAESHMIILGIAFLVLGLFVARPYCRFLCPYGALLKVTSLFSKKHLSITPAECIQCKLCHDSCPFEAIDYPTKENAETGSRKNINRFMLYSLLIPVWIFIGGYALSHANKFMSKAHPDVYLADLLIKHPELKNDTENIDIKTFMSSGKSFDTLVEEAKTIQAKFYTGGWIMGGFLGFVIGLTLLNQVIFRKREDYRANKGDCFSCGRCMDYCPVKK